MHCLDFPVMEYFTMKEFSTFGEVCNAEMDSATVGNFSCFVIGMLYLFDSLYDRADMCHSIMIESGGLINEDFSLYPFVRLLNWLCLIVTGMFYIS